MIPNIIHFIFGLDEGFGNKPFSIVHFLSVKSAIEVNRPMNVYFYYKYLPSGVWWERTKNMVQLVSIEVPDEIFGNPLLHYAHKSDILRIWVLLKYGGIYLDLDTICIKPLAPLYDNECVMGIENYKERKYGLCNAVILAKKGSLFLQYWLSSYKTFRSKGYDQFWSEHSVKIPLSISKLYPDILHIEPESSFFYPSYSQEDLELLFKKNFNFPESFVFHLWESLSFDKYLQPLTEESIKNEDTTYNCIARQYL